MENREGVKAEEAKTLIDELSKAYANLLAKEKELDKKKIETE